MHQVAAHVLMISPRPSQPRVLTKHGAFVPEQPFLSHTGCGRSTCRLSGRTTSCPSIGPDRNAKKPEKKISLSIHLGSRPENLWRSWLGASGSIHPPYLLAGLPRLVTANPSVLVLPSSGMLAMETSCFLASKPSPKSMALPSPAGIAKPKLHMQFSKRASSSVTCCSYNARPSEDGAAPAIDPDWRSFRAQLYFNEQYSKSVDPAVAAVAAAAAMPEPVKIGDKWAHPLVEPEKGCLLIATEKLDGSHIFERTVILLLSAGVLGPVGVILNRPSLMSIKETQTIFAETDIAGAFSGRPLFFGGPLEECFFLLGPRAAAGGDVVGRTGLFEEVMPGLHYGTRESVGCAAELVKRGVVGVRDFRFFDGFSGWEREQLRDEVRAGLWRVAACSPAVLGLASVVKGGLWEEVQGLVGERRVW